MSKKLPYSVVTTWSDGTEHVATNHKTREAAEKSAAEINANPYNHRADHALSMPWGVLVKVEVRG